MTENEELFRPAKVIDDRKLSIRDIRKQSGKPCKELLLEYQNYLRGEHRSFKWAHNLTCLKISQDSRQPAHRGNDLTLEEDKINIFVRQSAYVAVSYHNRKRKGENGCTGRYLIKKYDSGEQRKSVVRDTVIERAIKFAQYHQLNRFWIDDECLANLDESEQQEVIQEMDVVYHQCRYAVGILSKRIESIEHVELLDLFLQGRLFEKTHGSSSIKLVSGIGNQMFESLLNALINIFTDDWWDRCWTFQESHCSNRKMKLLMRCNSLGSRSGNLEDIEVVDGEIEFNLAELQTQSTRLCLAMAQERQRRTTPLWRYCERLLGKGRRYSILYELQQWKLGSADKLPMSASIISDVCNRDLAVKADMPAVVANCCNYTRRVHTLSLSGHISLSLLLLTLFLVNGDFLFNSSSIKEDKSLTLCKLLNKLSLGQWVIPRGIRPLTFLKRCRWPKVRLCSEGLQTRGNIWRTDQEIRIKYKPCVGHFDFNESLDVLSEFNQKCLRQLATRLKKEHPYLSHQISDFLREDSQTSNYGAAALQMMQTMAKAVCQAISKGHLLLLAKTTWTDECSAIFVSPWRRPRLPIFVATAWERGRLLEDVSELRAVERYVSVKVDPEFDEEGWYDSDDDDISDETFEAKKWIPKDWINGLCFFENTPKQDILLPWPNVLEQD